MQSFVERLADPSSTLESMDSVLSQLRERNDLLHVSDYAHVLLQLTPQLCTLLDTRVPALQPGASSAGVSASTQQLTAAVRSKAVEVLHRVPLNELRPFAERLAETTARVLATDSETNGVAACKLLAALLRHFRTGLQPVLPQVVNALSQIFSNAPIAATVLLNEDTADAAVLGLRALKLGAGGTPTPPGTPLSSIAAALLADVAAGHCAPVPSASTAAVATADTVATPSPPTPASSAAVLRAAVAAAEDGALQLPAAFSFKAMLEVQPVAVVIVQVQRGQGGGGGGG
jgi:hypothetical protein